MISKKKLGVDFDWENVLGNANKLGLSVNQVANAYECTTATVVRLCKLYNIRLKTAPHGGTHPRLSPEVQAQIREQWRIGATTGEICSIFGITEKTVYKYTSDVGCLHRKKRVRERIIDEEL